eukprot:COSAG04_NODE_17777_length_459_cov_0.941667_1_plen_57_part_10
MQAHLFLSYLIFLIIARSAADDRILAARGRATWSSNRGAPAPLACEAHRPRAEGAGR